MGRLTTHVLDTAQGIPAVGVIVVLTGLRGGAQTELGSAITNQDGRIDRPLLEGDDLVAGAYELDFNIARYFENQPLELSSPPFLDIVTIRFTIANADQNYHIPLLVSPWAYSTYRGN